MDNNDFLNAESPESKYLANAEAEIQKIQSEISGAFADSAAAEEYVPPEPPPAEEYAPPPEAPAPPPPAFYSETVKKRGKRPVLAMALAIVITAALFFAGGMFIPQHFTIMNATDEPARQIDELLLPNNPGASPENGFTFAPVPNPNYGDPVYSYAGIIDLVEPSVVSITSEVTAAGYGIFNIPGYPGGGAGRSESAGTGILFHETDTKCYIVTNDHVVSGGSNLAVSISGSEPIRAKVIGTDGNNDLAVISIDKEDMLAAGVTGVTLATFGDSSAMRVGDVVLAIGNAWGEGNTATNGIVSAINKTITVEGKSYEVMQTNAAINPGNSGGPLVNMKGEVIGINMAKLSESAGGANGSIVSEGMGYSIPSNIAKPIVEDLMNLINRPFLGVSCRTISDAFANQYSLPSAGAYINDVVEGSPAEKAGILRTDIVTSFNGRPVLSADQLVEYIAECQIGEVVELKVIRNGTDYITLKATLEAR